MKYLLYLFSIFLTSVLVVKEATTPNMEDMGVAEILNKLGDEPNPNLPNTAMEGVSATNGAQLFLNGFSVSPNGKKQKKQSKHFVCTSCHNIVPEDPDLSVSDPQARLEYAAANNLPFLQGTTMYGAVNRTRFYNGDYYKKYGELVDKARNDIREAIQLCAVECAQGRRLKHWEIESILSYLWTIDLTVGDLDLSAAELETLNAALENNSNNQRAIDLVKSKYLQASPATFVAPPEDREAGADGIVGKPENGKLVYEQSCLHCHKDERYSFYKLDNTELSFEHLDKHFPKYTRYSTYQVSRWGTSPLPGKRAYMPQYPKERLSVQQLEDLRAYVAQRVQE